MNNKSLDDVGLFCGTDKSSHVHDYLRKYEKYFPFDRNEKLKILEIGIENGASLKMWKNYYQQAEIVGIDINPKCVDSIEERISVELGSQFDYDFLNYISEKYGPFDLIVDDGSHFNEHVIFSFVHLFNHVKQGGLYVVEDASTSYWSDYGGSLEGENTMIAYFKNLIDEVNLFGEKLQYPESIHVGSHARKEEPLIKQLKSRDIHLMGFDVESINFLNSIVIVTKK